MSLKIWEINSLKLELDMEDADVQERYENAFEKLSEEENQIKRTGKCPNSREVTAICLYGFTTEFSARERPKRFSRESPSAFQDISKFTTASSNSSNSRRTMSTQI